MRGNLGAKLWSGEEADAPFVEEEKGQTDRGQRKVENRGLNKAKENMVSDCRDEEKCKEELGGSWFRLDCVFKIHGALKTAQLAPGISRQLWKA